MDRHLSPTQIRFFLARALPPPEMRSALMHLEGCAACREQQSRLFREMQGEEPVYFNLSPAFQFRHEHLDFEQLVALADQQLDEEDTEIVQIHLQACARCREDVRSFLAFRAESALELEVRSVPVQEKRAFWPCGQQWNWRTMRGKPLAAGMIAAALALGLWLIFFWRGLDRKEGRPPIAATPQTSASPAKERPPGNPEATLPPPPSSPPADSPEPLIVALRDHTREISLTRTGTMKGLASVPPALQEAIRAALRQQTLPLPPQLRQLRGEGGRERGSTAQSVAFHLVSPVGITRAEARPMLRWQAVAGATSYEVQIGDARGNEIARSGSLPTTSTAWQPDKALPRGPIYSWTVTAFVRGERLTAPAPAAPEARFRILSGAKLRQLEALKKRTPSHLALGIFYAREGMLPEAEQELQKLAEENPQSSLPTRLLRTLHSWQ